LALIAARKSLSPVASLENNTKNCRLSQRLIFAANQKYGILESLTYIIL
jgi:hypothetical protein